MKLKDIMKKIASIFIAIIILSSCQDSSAIDSPHLENFAKRSVDLKSNDSLESGISYLSVYSQIYSLSEHRTHNLTVTTSIRNTNLKDTIYIEKAEYFDTHGESIRSYFKSPIFIAPLETVEIVIDEIDDKGGTGANLIFEWQIKRGCQEPFFEGVMISTSGQQGLSFTTAGRRIK